MPVMPAMFTICGLCLWFDNLIVEKCKISALTFEYPADQLILP